jgi:quercetin dioxygenase-like cupin family protein
MPVLKFDESIAQRVKEGVSRTLIHTPTLMTAIIQFTNGPWTEPDPPHSHVHEQTTYIAEGELIFFCEDEPAQHLKAGDMFAVLSNKKHTIQLLSAHATLVDNFTPRREDFL